MSRKKMRYRQLKKEVLDLLASEDYEAICRFPARQVINPLFALFLHSEPIIKWRAVTAMGHVVSRLAEAEAESARVVMRRLMWTLNDESGGIGWGSPEAMGEICARSQKLAGEYHPIVISYIREDGNYLEHPILQRGAMWGVGRLANARPRLAREAAPCLVGPLESPDPYLRGLAAWTAGPLDQGPTKALLKALCTDNAMIPIYLDSRLREITVGQLAAQALNKP